MQLYRLRCVEKRCDPERVVGWAVTVGPWCVALIARHRPRGLWLHSRAWIEGAPDYSG